MNPDNNIQFLIPPPIRIADESQDEILEDNESYVISEKGISNSLVEFLKKNLVEKIYLSFSGGSDEGYLDASYETQFSTTNESIRSGDIHDVIYEAAWRGFSYSGAGDGSNYGDDYIFNLKTKKISHSWWEDRPKHTRLKPVKLETF
jgi:hypothetical protein